MGTLLFLILIAVSNDSLAQEIMLKVHERPVFEDMHSLVVMAMSDQKGEERIRRMESWSKTDKRSHETKMLIRFKDPADIRGTAFLIHEHKDRDDDMWFYLPTLRRVKRLAASGKSGSFMGSDFSNYDVGGGEYEDWSYRFVGEEEFRGKECWVIECIARGPRIERKTGYSKLLKWVSKENFNVVRTDHYDRSGSLFKRTIVDSLLFMEGVWFEKRIRAENLDTGHLTIMEFEDLEVNQGLKDDLFTVRSLKR